MAPDPGPRPSSRSRGSRSRCPRSRCGPSSSGSCCSRCSSGSSRLRERRPRALLAAPVFVLLWANLHGSFVLGPAILGYAWLADVVAGRSWRLSLGVLLAATLATLLNPYGPGAWAYAANIGTNPAIANQVSEWQRTSPFAVPGILFYPSVVIAGLVMALRRDRFRWPDWLLLAGMAVLGAWAVRGVAWWAFVLVFLAAAALAPAREPATERSPGPTIERPAAGTRRSLANGVIAVVLGILVVVALPWWRPTDPLTGRAGLLSYAPSGLAAAVRDAAPGARVAVPQTWASWFEWAAPHATYLIDSRFELFPAEVWSDAAAIEGGGAAATEVLDRRAVDMVVVAGARRPASRAGRSATRTATGCCSSAPARSPRRVTPPVDSPAGPRRARGEPTRRGVGAMGDLPGDAARVDLDVVVLGGGGHVGLPLSLALAKAGLRVGIYDTNEETLERIRSGEMPFLENGADELLTEILATGRLELASTGDVICRTRQLIVVVGTPVDEFLAPSMTIFEKTVDQIAPYLEAGTLVVLRSTVYPGTTRFVAQRLAALGRDVDVAFCPERIAEGHALEELHTLPQIVGSDDAAAGRRATELFRSLTDEIIRTSTKEAELAKLFTNVWRYMKFAVANQFFMIAHEAGVDYGNVLHAIRHEYPRATDLPAPGFAAGPCLFKDTMQLAAFTSDHFPLGQAAMQVNEGLPAYMVEALGRRYGDLAGKRIGILGMAFKAESDDIRASLSYKLRKLLDVGRRRGPVHRPVRARRPPAAARRAPRPR